MTVHMHSTVMRFIDALGTEAQKRRYFAEVVEHGRLFGSWGSEPAVSLSRSFLVETVVRQDRDSYVVDGVKHFCTMALGASHYMVWCALEGGTDMGKALLQVLVPADAPGIATDGKWDTLGMRATFSPPAPRCARAWWRASPSATPRCTWASRRARSPSRSTTPGSGS
jgi:alkylation response protein AidB-like acyl-CoA dehydrogenase